MTFLTGPSLAAKTAPVGSGKLNEHVIQMRVLNRQETVYRVPVRLLGPPLFILAAVALLMLACLGVMLAIIPNLTVTTVTRYHGFCTIPIKDAPEDPAYYERPSYKVMPLRWTSNPEVQVFSTFGKAAADEIMNGLREQFDVGDTVEKISVMDNGRHVNFIHDFEANMTGIVDSDRCFMMDLDQEMVMTPEVLVLSIEGGAKFDISRVRSTLRAALPAIQQMAAAAKELQEKCENKPTYRLLKEGVIIRKRAVDAPSHDYIQFAGRRVQEIEISNLADLLQHEQDTAAAAAVPVPPA